MDRPLLLSVAAMSALVGGLTGAFAATLLAPARKSEAPHELEAAPLDGAPRTLARLDALERAVQALELRRPTLVERTPNTAPGAAKPDPKRDAALIDDPVFEAAVLDVLARAETGRASERDARREERKKERVEQWGKRLTQELSLEPAQLTALLKAREELAKALEERWSSDAGAELSRRERRAQMDALRTEAENKLRARLNPRQAAAYDQLDPDLKLGRAAR